MKLSSLSCSFVLDLVVVHVLRAMAATPALIFAHVSLRLNIGSKLPVDLARFSANHFNADGVFFIFSAFIQRTCPVQAPLRREKVVRACFGRLLQKLGQQRSKTRFARCKVGPYCTCRYVQFQPMGALLTTTFVRRQKTRSLTVL